MRALFAAEAFSYERITKYFLRQIVLDDQCKYSVMTSIV